MTRSSDRLDAYITRKEKEEYWNRRHRVRYVMGYQMPVPVDDRCPDCGTLITEVAGLDYCEGCDHEVVK